MKIEYFLESLKKDLEIESIEKFSLDTDIVQIDEWDSLTLLVFKFLILIPFTFFGS